MRNVVLASLAVVAAAVAVAYVVRRPPADRPAPARSTAGGSSELWSPASSAPSSPLSERGSVQSDDTLVSFGHASSRRESGQLHAPFAYDDDGYFREEPMMFALDAGLPEVA